MKINHLIAVLLIIAVIITQDANKINLFNLRVT